MSTQNTGAMAPVLLHDAGRGEPSGDPYFHRLTHVLGVDHLRPHRDLEGAPSRGDLPLASPHIENAAMMP